MSMHHKMTEVIIICLLVLIGCTTSSLHQAKSSSKSLLIDPESVNLETVEDVVEYPLLINLDLLPENWAFTPRFPPSSPEDSTKSIIVTFKPVDASLEQEPELTQFISIYSTPEEALASYEKSVQIFDNHRQSAPGSPALPSDHLSIQDSQADEFMSFCRPSLSKPQANECRVSLLYSNVEVNFIVIIREEGQGLTRQAFENILNDINQKVKTLK